MSRDRVARAWQFLTAITAAPSLSHAMNNYEELEGKEREWGPYKGGPQPLPGEEVWPFYAAGYYEDKAHKWGGSVDGDEQPLDTTDFALRLEHKKCYGEREGGQKKEPIYSISHITPKFRAEARARARTAAVPKELSSLRKGEGGGEEEEGSDAPTSLGLDSDMRDASGNVYKYLERHLELRHYEYKADTVGATFPPDGGIKATKKSKK